jgi:hypothetical protein
VGAWFLALNLMKIGTLILRWPHLSWPGAAGPQPMLPIWQPRRR